jgi:hypothetical protein
MTDDDILADWTRRDECLHGANTVIWFARCIERKAVAAERERCAKLCEHGIDLGGLNDEPAWQKYTADLLTGCAAMIRIAP